MTNPPKKSISMAAYIAIWSFAVLWLGIVIKLGSIGWYHRPSGFVITRLQSAIVTPMCFFWMSYLLLPRFRQLVLSLDLLMVNAIQCWRVAGIAILVIWGYGLLPGGFAIPMSILDASVGILALAAVRWVLFRPQRWKQKVLLANALGFADFFVTIGLAFVGKSLSIDPPLLSGQYADLRSLPLCVFPAFAIPFFSCLHFVVFAQLYNIGKDSPLKYV